MALALLAIGVKGERLLRGRWGVSYHMSDLSMPLEVASAAAVIALALFLPGRRGAARWALVALAASLIALNSKRASHPTFPSAHGRFT